MRKPSQEAIGKGDVPRISAQDKSRDTWSSLHFPNWRTWVGEGEGGQETPTGSHNLRPTLERLHPPLRLPATQGDRARPHHGQVDVGSVELQVDLAVDGGLRVLVVVLAHLRDGRGHDGG